MGPLRRDIIIILAVALGSVLWLSRMPEPKRIRVPEPDITKIPHGKTPFPSFPVFPTSIPISDTIALKVPVVMYHYVETVRDPRDVLRVAMAIKPGLFDSQMAALAKFGYTSYFVRDIPTMLQLGHLPSPKPIVLTFDDGYEDFYTDAFPILKKYGIKSTQFVICNLMGTPGYMTKEQVIEIHKSGLVEIGAHTMNHPNLKSVPDEVAKREITSCKSVLEKLTGAPVRTFAYPYGGYNGKTPKMVSDAGFSAAVSVNPGDIQSKSVLFTMPRIRAGHLVNTSHIDSILQNWK